MVTLPTAKHEGLQFPGPGSSSDSENFDAFFNNRFYYGGINNYRSKAYHRLDFNYTYSKQLKKSKKSWIFSVYNLYNRKNPFFFYNDNNKIKQFNLFPIIPSVAYQLEF